GIGKLVRRTDDEVRKRVLRIQRVAVQKASRWTNGRLARAATRRLGTSRRPGSFRGGAHRRLELARNSPFDADAVGGVFPRELSHSLDERWLEVRLHPVPHELV